MPGCCSLITSAFLRGRRSFWSPACFTHFRCCSDESAAWCRNCFPAAIWKRDAALTAPTGEMPMLNRRHLMLATALSAILTAAPAPAQERIKVIATFSILADLAKNVGGDRMDVDALVGPNGDAHVYAPAPADAKKVADAKVVVTNGLGFEGWIARLVKASGSKAPIVVASKGVKARKAEGG